MSRLRALLSHGALALGQAGLVALVIVVLIAGTALAGKGGGSSGGGKPGGGGSSITVVPLDGWANYGDQVQFTVTTSNEYPTVSLNCSQGGVVVYGDSRPYYWPNIWDDPGIFTLSSLAWTGGAADCTASIRAASHGKVVTLGSTSFHVDA